MGERIKQRRLELGISQGELSKRSGLSRVQISNLERGECKNAHSKTLMALAVALETTVNWLFFGTSV